MKSSAKLSGAVVCLFTISAALAKPPASPEFLNSGKVYPANVPLAEAVRIDNTLLLSGQIGIEPGTLKLVPGGLKAEAKQTMENIKTTLEAHGYALSDLVKCTVMLADIAKWGEFNDIYKTYFTDRFPARSALGVTGLALGAQVEVDCMAYRTAK
jgi:2-iminobutanoate/2-iminopropanoate deaminase